MLLNNVFINNLNKITIKVKFVLSDQRVRRQGDGAAGGQIQVPRPVPLQHRGTQVHRVH